jgi:hypothetical protein
MPLVLIWPLPFVVFVYSVLGDPAVQFEFVHGPLIETDWPVRAALSMCLVSDAVNAAPVPPGA